MISPIVVRAKSAIDAQRKLMEHFNHTDMSRHKETMFVKDGKWYHRNRWLAIAWFS